MELLNKIKKYFKRPKCKYNHQCIWCNECESYYQDGILVKYICRINAR